MAPRKKKTSSLTPDITGEVQNKDRASYVRDPASKFPPKAREDIAAALETKPVYVEHSDHLVMMEKLIAEVAGLRAAIVEGFDKLVAHMLDDAVEEAAIETQEPPPLKVDVQRVDLPDAPTEDASKKSLAPAHDATLDDVRDALNAYTRSHGLAEASKVVQGLGVKRLTELPPERYGEAVAAFQE